MGVYCGGEKKGLSWIAPRFIISHSCLEEREGKKEEKFCYYFCLEKKLHFPDKERSIQYISRQR